MSTQKKLRKITMAASVVVVTVGLVTAFSLNASADTGAPGEGDSCLIGNPNTGHCTERYDVVDARYYYKCSAEQFGQPLNCIPNLSL